MNRSFRPSHRTSVGRATRPAEGKPTSVQLCFVHRRETAVTGCEEQGCLSRQVKDRSGKSDREWEGLAEEENLMGKSECDGSTSRCQSDLSSVCHS